MKNQFVIVCLITPRKGIRLIDDYTLVFANQDTDDDTVKINVPFDCIQYKESLKVQKEPLIVLTPYALKIYNKYPFKMSFIWEEE